MSKEKGKTQNKKRKLTRQEKKQIDALIRQSKGDGKPHTAQDSIPFERMYKDGICRLANGRYSKCIEFEDINLSLIHISSITSLSHISKVAGHETVDGGRRRCPYRPLSLIHI